MPEALAGERPQAAGDKPEARQHGMSAERRGEKPLPAVRALDRRTRREGHDDKPPRVVLEVGRSRPAARQDYRVEVVRDRSAPQEATQGFAQWPKEASSRKRLRDPSAA